MISIAWAMKSDSTRNDIRNFKFRKINNATRIESKKFNIRLSFIQLKLLYLQERLLGEYLQFGTNRQPIIYGNFYANLRTHRKMRWMRGAG